MAEQFRLYLLGGFRLERISVPEKNGAPVRLPTQKSKALLAYLALYPQEHSREKLAALFWGDSSDYAARKSLRVALQNLYKGLGKHFFTGDRATLQLAPDAPLWVDAVEFARDWSLETKDQVASLQSPISLYRGELLHGFYDDWILEARERFKQQYIELLLKLVTHSRSASEYASAVETAQKILAADRANEAAHQHLIFLYAAQGDRSTALKQFDECARALDEELGVEPSPETIVLAKKIKQQKTGAASEYARLTNLPSPLTSFVGREREMEEIREMLGGGRREEGGETRAPLSSLLTLTGPGGSGKTRLALESGRALVDEFEHGVWWVELAPLADASFVPSAVAKALGIQEQANESITQTLVNALRERELLLILDNCEHLIDACAQLVQALISGSSISILATSREGLNLPGEQIYPVAPLAVPRVASISLAQLAQEFSAVRLFVERARLSSPQFVLDDANAAQVIQICTRLDGIPLALELAAARVKQMPVSEIAARLAQRFDLLVGARTALPRQQTLRALMDWSYDLLNDAEKILFRRLSVFAGGWTIESAEEICADEKLPRANILDTLLHLVDKSLAQPNTANGSARYVMLETVLAYARDELDATDESETFRARHLRYFVTLAESGYRPPWERQDRAHWTRLEQEYANLRAALEDSLSCRDIQAALALSGALGVFWYYTGRTQEARAWYARVFELAGEEGAAHLRARALGHAGTMEWVRADFARAKQLHEQALEHYRAAKDADGMAFALNNIATQLRHLGEPHKALELVQQGLALASQQHNTNLEILLLALRAIIIWEEFNEPQRARSIFENVFALARSSSNPYLPLITANLGELEQQLGAPERAMYYLDQALLYLEPEYHVFLTSMVERQRGIVALTLGNVNAARAALQKTLRNYSRMGGRFEFCGVLVHWAALEALMGAPRRAAALAAYAQTQVVETLHARFNVMEQAQLEKLTVQLREQLGAREFERAWAVGKRMTHDAVMALVEAGETTTAV